MKAAEELVIAVVVGVSAGVAFWVLQFAVVITGYLLQALVRWFGSICDRGIPR